MLDLKLDMAPLATGSKNSTTFVYEVQVVISGYRATGCAHAYPHGAGDQRAVPGLSESGSRGGPEPAARVAGLDGAARRVRPSALEGPRSPVAGCRTRRYGLYRGLSLGEVPARGQADRHERVRRRGPIGNHTSL